MADPAVVTYPSIPAPAQDLKSLQASVERLKEVVEMLTGQRGPTQYSFPEGMLQLTKQAGVASGRFTQLNEVVVGGRNSLVQRTAILQAEVVAARDGEANLSAKITAVDTARIDGDTVLAQSVNTLSTTVGSYSATISTLQTSYNGISVSYGLYGNIDGVTGSMVFEGARKLDGSGTNFTVTFNSDVIINGNLLVTNTVPTPKIVYNAINAVPSITVQTIRGSFGADGVWHDALVAFVAGETGAYSFMSVQLSMNVYVPGGAASLVEYRVISDYSGELISPVQPNMGVASNTAGDGSLLGTFAFAIDPDTPTNTNFRIQIRNTVTSGSGRIAFIHPGSRITVEVRKR